MRYFLSFVEEAVLNPQYAGFVGGRIEVDDGVSPYSIEEIKFLTPRQEAFEQFRDAWDFEWVTEEQLDEIRQMVRSAYQE